ncbi:type II secretion system F family protein [Candidatus Berkelbacteria bacterium]|nr:type II secretion system F family protein [Candidatus Berkelbacteria bacterium]
MENTQELHKPKDLMSYLPFAKKVSNHDKALFAKESSTMLSAGLHLTQAIAILRRQIKNAYFVEVLTTLETEIKEGKQLSTAMAQYPNVFDRVMVNIVRAGEASGQLDKQLKELGDQLESQNKFFSKIKGALVYPMFVLVVMVGIGILATVKIIPAIRGIIESSGGQLPMSTKIVLGLSDFLINKWYIIVLIIVGTIVALGAFFKSPSGHVLKDRLLLRDPTGLFSRLFISRFTRTLGLLITAGVPIVDAVRIVEDVIGNSVFSQSLYKVAGELERGIPISSALQEDPIFPDYVIQMMVVGEQTGQMDKVLLGLAAYYEEQANDKVGALTALFEPAIIVIIGVGVGFLVFSILIPIYNATTSSAS